MYNAFTSVCGNVQQNVLNLESFMIAGSYSNSISCSLNNLNSSSEMGSFPYFSLSILILISSSIRIFETSAQFWLASTLLSRTFGVDSKSFFVKEEMDKDLSSSQLLLIILRYLCFEAFVISVESVRED